MKVTIGAITSAWLVILGSLAQLFAQEPAQQQQPEFTKQGEQLMGEGKLQDALRCIARFSRSRRILLPRTSQQETHST